MRTVNVLSTACGAMFMPGFFSCLKDNGERTVKIVGVDIVDDAVMGDLIDVYYKVPSYSAENYIDTLIEICLKEKIDVFFPHISMELPVILANMDKFRNIGVKVAISDNNTLLTANNKLKLYDCMRNAGLETPKYYPVTDADTLIKGAEALGYPYKPVVVKITESSGSRGVRIIDENFYKSHAFLNEKPNSLKINMADMSNIINECKKLPDTIVMEYLPGSEYTVDLLADHGKTLYIAGRLNYESSMSIAMASRLEKREETYNLCEKIVEILKLDGNIGFDFMLDENDVPVLTDLNPRITATIVIYKEGGLNFPYLRIKQLLGEELPDINVNYDVKMKRRYLDIFADGGLI